MGKKVKNILLKIEFEGNGVVNMDSNDQKYVLKDTHLRARYENVSFAKKSFTINEDGKLDYKLKISRDCILHDMYKYNMVSNVPNIVHNDYLFYNHLASTMSLVKGYMYANKAETLKRKGAITLCDAVQTCNAFSSLEVFSRSGEKVTNDGTTEKSDNSFYYKETVGDIKYSTKGDLDLMNLQFVSCDSIFDRYSFNPDKFEIYKNFLKISLPNFNGELGYYQLKDSNIEIPEYGILLSDEDVLKLVKETLTSMLKINIKRKGAYAKVSSVKIKLVSDPLIDTFNNDNDWISLKTDKDVNDLNFETEFFYNEINIEEAKSSRLEFEEKIKTAKEDAKKADKESKDIKNANKKSLKNNIDE